MSLHLIGLPGILALLCAWSLALVVLLTGPGLSRDRLLALLLFVEGTAWGTGGGLIYQTSSAEVGWCFQAVFCAALLALPACQLAVVGTLPSTWVAPLRNRFVLAGLVLATVAAEVYYLSDPIRFVGEMVPAWYATWDAALPDITVSAFNVVGLAGLVSLLGSISAWKQSARGSWARKQAKAFALAFGVHDTALLFAMGAPGHLIPPPPSGQWTDALVILGCSVGSLLFVSLLGYGILKVQLFDVDLHIKRGLKRSTVAAIFVFVFIVVEQLVSNYFNGQFGVLMGAIVAGLMLFGLDHIRQFAGKVANEAMPNVSATPEYVAYRKLEVYRAAFEGLNADGQVTDKERAMLEKLRLKLGIALADAQALEADMCEQMASTAPG